MFHRHKCTDFAHISRAGRGGCHFGASLSLRTQHDTPRLALELNIECHNCMLMENQLFIWYTLATSYCYISTIMTEIFPWHVFNNSSALYTILSRKMQWYLFRRIFPRHYVYRRILQSEYIILLWHLVDKHLRIHIFSLHAEWRWKFAALWTRNERLFDFILHLFISKSVCNLYTPVQTIKRKLWSRVLMPRYLICKVWCVQ